MASVLGKRARKSEHAEAPLNSNRSRKRVHILEDDEDIEVCLSATPDDRIVHVDASTSPLGNLKCKSALTRRKRAVALSPMKQDAVADEENTSLRKEVTPETLGHRNAPVEKIPVTPRHRLNNGSRLLTPRTPRTLFTSKSAPRNVYTEARRMFARGSNPGTVVGREHERSGLLRFISSRVQGHMGGCLYISGPPGTGKSALVTDIYRQYQDSGELNCAYINCMSVKSAEDVLSLAAADLAITSKVPREALGTVFLQKKGNASYLVVLDEIDSLLNIDLDILYKFVEWALAPHSRLVLIGIANALDLTDRFLPRLKSRNLRPELLPFLPYTSAEIASILTAKCRSLLPAALAVSCDHTPILHPNAIQLISKKVASQTGDLRKAFDLAQRVTDLVETETRDKLAQEAPLEEHHYHSSPIRSPLSENNNLSSPMKWPATHSSNAKCQPSAPKSCLVTLTPEEAPRATMAHVVCVTSTTFGNGISQRLKALNFQQKAVLCSLLALDRHKGYVDSLSPPLTPERKLPATTKRQGQAAPTLRALSQAYSALCSRDNHLHALSQTEFRDIVRTLEASSLVASKHSKNGSLSSLFAPNKRGRGVGCVASNGDDCRLSACFSIRDLETALEGIGASILKGILHGDSLG